MPKVTPIKFVPKGACRLSYVNVFEPAPAMQPGQDPVRSVSLLFPKSHTEVITDLYNKLNQIIAESVKVGNITAAAVNAIHNPLRDGDAEVATGNRGKEYAGMVFMSAKSWRPIGVVNPQNQPILDPDELYSGCWANVQIAYKWFDRQGNKGIRVEINLVQKVRDDDRFDGADSAEDVFTATEEPGDSGVADAPGIAIPSIPPLGVAVPEVPNVAAPINTIAETDKAQKTVEETGGGKITNPFAEFV